MVDRLRRANLDHLVTVDSAGTGDWHIGKRADPRAIAAAGARGVEVTSIARQVSPGDFDEFDLVVAMDASNHDDLGDLPGADRSRLRLMREFAGEPGLDVPDPYYGEDDGFEEVLDILERSCDGLIAEIRSGRIGRAATDRAR